MKCLKEIRECPHGWKDCNLCANLEACNNGTYIPEPDPVELVSEPNEITEPELSVDLSIPIPSERGTWSEKFAKMTPDERMAEIYRYHPDDLISKEPYKCMPGGMSPGGGSRAGRVKKSNKGTKIPVDPWTSNT